MTFDWSAIVDGGIPVLAGLYLTALGYGWIGRQRAQGGRWTSLVPHFRWLGPLLVLFGIFLGWETHQRAAHPSAEQLARQIAAQLALPSNVDEATRIDAVVGEGEVITYRYTVLVPIDPAVGRAGFEAKLREQARSQACSDGGLGKLLRAGYTVELRYALMEAGQPISIVMPPRFCETASP